MSPVGKQAGSIASVRIETGANIRRAILAAAASVLSEEGPAALTLRRVAEAVGASTKLIYTHFGGKEGLLGALYLESFAALTDVFRIASSEPDPVLRLRRMTEAYRRFALGEPALYNVMFGDLGKAWEAPIASRRQAWRSFAALRDAVGALCEGEASSPGSTTRLTYMLWATMHGAVSLELRKLLGASQSGEQLFRLAVAAILDAASDVE